MHRNSNNNNKNNWGYLKRNSLLWKVHKIRDNLCCCCACPQACREPSDSLWAKPALPCLLSQTSHCTGEANPGSMGVCPALLRIGCPPWISALHTHRMASLLQVLISTELLCSAVCKGRMYLICLKLTNPPVLGNKTKLRREGSSLFWNDQML